MEATAALEADHPPVTDSDGRGRSVLHGTAQTVIMAGPLLAILSSIALLSGSLAQSDGGSAVLVGLAYSLPPCLALMFSTFSARDGAYGRAAIVSVLGGVLALADVVVSALSAAYANPCFDKAHCAAGPTFGYAALTAASMGFLITAAVGLIFSPIAIALLARYERFFPE